MSSSVTQNITKYYPEHTIVIPILLSKFVIVDNKKTAKYMKSTAASRNGMRTSSLLCILICSNKCMRGKMREKRVVRLLRL